MVCRDSPNQPKQRAPRIRLGYLFGRNLLRLEHYIGQASVAIVLLVALLVALGLGWRWFRANSDTLATSVAHFGHRIATLRSVQDFRERHARAWRFAIVRFARREYLDLHLMIGLLIVSVRATAF
jgi:hypothetical protein